MPNMVIDEKMINFLLDWKNRTKDQQKRYMLLSVAVFIVTFMICIFAFSWFQTRNYRRIVQQNMNYIQDSTVQGADRIERELKEAVTSITSISVQYAELLKIQKNATVEDNLRFLTNKDVFDRIAFVYPDGTDISLEGKSNVADRSYFESAMKGASGWEYIEKSRTTGRPSTIFYSPVIVDEEIIGVVLGFYEQERIDSLLPYKTLNYTPRTYLMRKDGTIVSSSREDMIGQNIYGVLSEKDFTGDVDQKEIKAAVDDKDRTTVSFTFNEGRTESIGVIVQFAGSEWMIMSVLPDSVTAEMLRGANFSGFLLLGVIAVTFLCMMGFMVFHFAKESKRYEKEIEVAIENFEETMEFEQYQLSIITSLADTYSSVYYVNIETGTYQRIKEDELLSRSIPEEGLWAEGINAYITQFVDEGVHDELRKFTDIGTVRERLYGDTILSMEYQRKNKGWRRASVFRVKRDEKFILSFVFAVQRIDQEKKKELETKKALEEAYESARLASNAKTVFLSNMSHDIRTPMNAIVGMTAIAAANINNETKVSDCLKKITASSKHLLGLINEVLDMSKIESGKVDLYEEEFSISEVIDTLVSINKPMVDEKNHTLIVTINNVVHENVLGDSSRLQQVLTNILSNAIKYTPEGGRIEISVSEKETNKNTVGWFEIVFKDNGIGMSKEFQQNMFEPFSRAKDNRIIGIQGTGLGMPIAKNIIRMMNGDITVESEINKGSTFTVSFCLKLQQEEEVDYESFVDLPVLVVDDDVSACESTCLMLNDLKMNSEWVTSGAEAVDKTVEHHEKDDDYYAVIVDWKMPDMNGIETTREIRKQVGDDVPIIIISAYDWVDIEQEAKEAGVTAFLSKPLFRSRVVTLFNDLLDKKTDGGAKDAEESSKEEYDFSGKRLLIVEDNEINREIAEELLAMAGFETETAENGKISVDKVSESEPGYYDAILMDIQMPVMDGYEATKAIRTLKHPDAKTIPIIAMTANAFSTDVRAAFKAGMNGHIAKPIDLKRVLEILGKHLNPTE